MPPLPVCREKTKTKTGHAGILIGEDVVVGAHGKRELVELLAIHALDAIRGYRGVYIHIYSYI